MKTRPRIKTILAIIFILSIIPMTAQAGKILGTSFLITADPEREVSPSIAYNSKRKEYLVVWYNDRDSFDDIRAQRVGSDGKLLGNAFYIAAQNAERRFPDVAYDSEQDVYLVVWEQYQASEGYSIKGRRILGQGIVLDDTDIDIRDSGYNLYTPTMPAVAYSSISHRFLVVWAETWHPMPITYSIEGQEVDYDGWLGSHFTISQGSDSREKPDLAYNRHADRYLVVWQQKAGSLYQIHGQQVYGDGGVYQGDINIYSATLSGTSPAVASIPTASIDEKFLVVLETDNWGDRDIYGRTVQENGTASFGSVISYDLADESSPAVSGSELSQQYFVTWRLSQGVVDQPIKGRAVFFAGGLQVGEIAEFSATAAYNPAVAAGPLGDFLIAWQDQPVFGTNQHIYGQLWGNRIYLSTVKK